MCKLTSDFSICRLMFRRKSYHNWKSLTPLPLLLMYFRVDYYDEEFSAVSSLSRTNVDHETQILRSFSLIVWTTSPWSWRILFLMLSDGQTLSLSLSSIVVEATFKPYENVTLQYSMWKYKQPFDHQNEAMYSSVHTPCTKTTWSKFSILSKYGTNNPFSQKRRQESRLEVMAMAH